MRFREDCRFFSGYKPCKLNDRCHGCKVFAPRSQSICILSLEAMGAVLRSTVLLPPIKRAYPEARVTWVTLKASAPLLASNPYIDELILIDGPDAHGFFARSFDVLYAVDKSASAGGLAERIRAKTKRGFGLTETGVIRPFSHHAGYLFEVGLDDDLKFRENQQPETRMITEAMGLSWVRDPYVLELTTEEQAQVEGYRREFDYRGAAPIIGFNTGCSTLFPYKKLTVTRAIDLVSRLRSRFPESPIFLLGGGPVDEARQKRIKEKFAADSMVVDTPTRTGLRNGILWVDACDLVLTGCTLGQHIAIARRKQIVSWYTVSCSQEIDLYDRGFKVEAAVPCSPCWRRECDRADKCYDAVSLDKVVSFCEQILVSAPA